MACDFPADWLTVTLQLFFFCFFFNILFQKQFFCTQQLTDVLWPRTAIRQNDINLLILDSTLIILFFIEMEIYSFR